MSFAKTPLQRLADAVHLLAMKTASHIGTDAAQDVIRACEDVWTAEEERLTKEQGGNA